MAEKFVSYLKVVSSSATTEPQKQIVPFGVSGNNTVPVDVEGQGNNVRTIGATVVINGLYITSNVANQDNNISLYITDSTYPNRKIYVIRNIAVPVGVSFFLERAITLGTTQGLFLELSGSNKTMHASASCIEITN